jgi:enoyl-CoA hydratase/carnithine racemase
MTEAGGITDGKRAAEGTQTAAQTAQNAPQGENSRGTQASQEAGVTKAPQRRATSRGHPGWQEDTAMAYETMLYDVKDQVATITLNRPEKLNAWTATMGDELYAAMEAADADKSVRAIVLTGAGRAFCAGADISGFNEQMKASESDGPRAERRRPTTPFPELMRRLTTPTIAAINGYALGVGCTMTLLCDIRIASDNAMMGVIFPRVGLITELGSTYILPRLIGVSRAAEMMLTGRRFSANECLNMGLLSYVTPPDKLIAKARELTGEIIQCSPTSIALTKQALYEGLEGTLETAMHYEGFAIERCYSSAEHKEYVTAFMEKRKPDFSRVAR